MAMGRTVPFIAGLIEFLLSGLMFVMANFALAGYFVMTTNPLEQNVATTIQFYMGILAALAFVFGLAGSASAAKRWSVLLSVAGASLIAFWGLVMNWYAITWLAPDLGEIRLGIMFGTAAIFSSLLVIILVVASKEHFRIAGLKPRYAPS
jgi:uncharacterized membrane protein (GlpM family)